MDALTEKQMFNLVFGGVFAIVIMIAATNIWWCWWRSR